MANKNLGIGKKYWIFDGRMQPWETTLIEIVNNGRTAVLESVVRKVSSVYPTKEAALKIGKY